MCLNSRSYQVIWLCLVTSLRERQLNSGPVVIEPSNVTTKTTTSTLTWLWPKVMMLWFYIPKWSLISPKRRYHYILIVSSPSKVIMALGRLEGGATAIEREYNILIPGPLSAPFTSYTNILLVAMFFITFYSMKHYLNSFN